MLLLQHPNDNIISSVKRLDTYQFCRRRKHQAGQSCSIRNLSLSQEFWVFEHLWSASWVLWRPASPWSRSLLLGMIVKEKYTPCSFILYRSFCHDFSPKHILRKKIPEGGLRSSKKVQYMYKFYAHIVSFTLTLNEIQIFPLL